MTRLWGFHINWFYKSFYNVFCFHKLATFWMSYGIFHRYVFGKKRWKRRRIFGKLLFSEGSRVKIGLKIKSKILSDSTYILFYRNSFSPRSNRFKKKQMQIHRSEKLVGWYRTICDKPLFCRSTQMRFF